MSRKTRKRKPDREPRVLSPAELESLKGGAQPGPGAGPLVAQPSIRAPSLGGGRRGR